MKIYCNVRNTLFISVFLFIGVQSVWSQTRAELIFQHLKNPTKNYVLAVSHRGDWRSAPENSLQAIQRCIDLGVDIVEIDVRKTKDGHLILMHDKTVNRTTNGRGKVSELTLKQIKDLRLRNACGIKGSKITVPTLEEAMTLSKNKILVNLDKIEGDLVAEAYQILKKTKTVKQAILKGRVSADKMNKKYGSIMKEIVYMPIVNYSLKKPNQFITDYNKSINPIAYELLFSSVETKNFKEIKRLNNQNKTVLAIALWDELCAGYTDEKMLLEGAEASWGQLIKFGINAIMTDRPSELINYLKVKELRNF